MFMSAEEAEELAVKTAKELEINVCEKMNYTFLMTKIH